ncbi:hypothetical protein EDB80DRAFT_417308 [Ilyonectria destructans]|nr:hypothetical protein EDB80DRAFT_417308 [Ilyonectria destructans]
MLRGDAHLCSTLLISCELLARVLYLPEPIRQCSATGLSERASITATQDHVHTSSSLQMISQLQNISIPSPVYLRSGLSMRGCRPRASGLCHRPSNGP